MVGEPKPEHPLHPHRPPLSRRQLVLQVVVATVILASGIGIGTGGTILALKNRIIPGMRVMPPNPRFGPEPNEIVTRWRGEYSLSDKQAQQAKDTLTKEFTAIAELRQKFFQAEQAERAKFAEAMKKILTSEQYTEWDSDIKKMVEHMQRARSFDGRRGGRGGPPRGDRGPGRPKDPNDRRWDGPPRPPMDADGPRGGWPPRPPMESGGRRGDWSPRAMDPNNLPKDRPPDRPIELNSRPAEANAPK